MSTIPELESLTESPLCHYVIGDEVAFDVDDVWAKYGFCDGDIVSDLYYEYMAKKGVDFYTSRTGPDHLFEVVNRLVIPQVTPPLNLKKVTTCHNSVRCFDEKVIVSPGIVYVKVADILAVFDTFSFESNTR